MTGHRLAEIRAGFDRFDGEYRLDSDLPVYDAAVVLLSEVDRLRSGVLRIAEHHERQRDALYRAGFQESDIVAWLNTEVKRLRSLLGGSDR